jgi:dipeptidyl aminopeptidase/acylaminoacyl peptidase
MDWHRESGGARIPRMKRILLLTAAGVLLSTPARAQVTKADYERAIGLREKYQALTVNVPEPATWIEKKLRFHYRRWIKGGNEHMLVDVETKEKRPAFDHARLAQTLNKLVRPKEEYTPLKLPFNTFRFVDEEKGIEFNVEGTTLRCTLAEYECKKAETPVPGFRRGRGGPTRNPEATEEFRPRKSPDGKWEALVNNFNIAVQPAGGGKLITLSTDGSEGNFYDPWSIEWSPDSTKIAACRVRPGYHRYVHYVESSPEDQLQPKNTTMLYAKPGDMLDLEQPALFSVDPPRQVGIENDLFQNPFNLSDLVWRKDSRAVTFEYNQRGHQLFRVIEVNASTGTARAVITEEPKTFFYYNQAGTSRSAGKRFRHDVADGKEVIWMSERDGWNHLYLYDGVTGRMKSQITKGNWAVRSVEKVDEEKRLIWFTANGMYEDKDPYFLHLYRINFDGTGLTTLTKQDADHSPAFSSDQSYYVDTYSRVDTAPVSELRRTSDGSLVMELERGDITDLKAAGWAPPEVFVAKGRDGKTDIWGVIFRPANLDPSKKYPVVENIYAGPQGSFVPKTFAAYSQMQTLAELGFVVVQIDGMGTSNRSKAFHDVAWHNLADAGFPDRILWHKAVAAKYPYYDISRVGIYGNSAGGQNSMGALLFHPEFYKAALSSVGCHDNRMDKLWWNEQWMGWPIGPQYSASSNVDNAHKLQGKVLLVVGELDNNVDPSSTMQVVNALIKANKTFDLLVIPGAGHGHGGAYGERKRYDFFVQNLLGQTPPDWNQPEKTTKTTDAAAKQP